MRTTMKFRYAGKVFEIATCRSPERAAELAEGHPDGVIDVEQMIAKPTAEKRTSSNERAWVVAQCKLALAALERDAQPPSDERRHFVTSIDGEPV